MDTYLRGQNDEARLLFHRLEALRKQIRRLESQYPSTLVMQDRKEPRETFVLVRGRYDQAGEKVVAATPRALPALDADADGSRLTLARWLTHAKHPLTARVTVNRIWQQHFGVGIVKTSEDFGAQGDWPIAPTTS